MPFAKTQMDLGTVIQSEVCQKEKNKYHLISLTCGIQKMLQMNLFSKQKQRHRCRTQMYSPTMGGKG